MCAWTVDARQEPPSKLPIPTDPAVPPAHIHAVARGILLIQLYIAQQPRPHVAPFQKIVAENPVLGKAARECPFEGVDLIDALADERAFTEQVLVDIGDGARIGIDAGLTPVELRIARLIREL